MKRISLNNRYKLFISIILAAAAVIFCAGISFAGEDDIRADEITADDAASDAVTDDPPANDISSDASPADAAVISQKLDYFQGRSGARGREKAGALSAIEQKMKKRVVAAVVCDSKLDKESAKFVGHYLKKKLVSLGYEAVVVRTNLSDKTSRDLAARWLMKKYGAGSSIIVDVKKYRRLKKFSPLGAYVDAAFFGLSSRAEIVLNAKFYSAKSKAAVYERTAWAVKRNNVLVAFQRNQETMSRCAGAAVANLLDGLTSIPPAHEQKRLL